MSVVSQSAERPVRDDLPAEIGWVLSNARQHAEDRRMHKAAQFSLAVSPPVHRAQVGRWESGATGVNHAQVRQYEVVLGLPEGQLLATIDLLARERQLITSRPHLVPTPTPTWEDETDDLLDRARSEERMTGLQWRTLATHLGSITATFLRRDDWSHLLRRVAQEAEFSTHLEYVLRDEAKMALASHPRSTSTVVGMCEELLSNPVAPVYADLLGLLPTASGPGAVELVLRHLDNPIGEAAHFSLMGVARTMVTRGQVSPAQLQRVGRHALEVLDDSATSQRLQRAAASIVELLDAPQRRRVVAGLRSSTLRARVERIIHHGGALADEHLAQLTQEVAADLTRSQGVRGDLHPVFARILHRASSLSAEDVRGVALSVLMLVPQGPVVGLTYARALRWALVHGPDVVIDEALSVLSWLLPPESVPWMLELALDPRTHPTRATQALTSIGNARTPLAQAPAGHGPDDVVEAVRRSALAQMTHPGPAPADTARGHYYLLGLYGRFDVIGGLADAAAQAGVPTAWADGIRSWLATPQWARPDRL